MRKEISIPDLFLVEGLEKLHRKQLTWNNYHWLTLHQWTASTNYSTIIGAIHTSVPYIYSEHSLEDWPEWYWICSNIEQSRTIFYLNNAETPGRRKKVLTSLLELSDSELTYYTVAGMDKLCRKACLELT